MTVDEMIEKLQEIKKESLKGGEARLYWQSMNHHFEIDGLRVKKDGAGCITGIVVN